MSKLKYISGSQLSYFAISFAIVLSKEFDLEDLNILGNIFNAIGDSIGIIAAQEEAVKDLTENKQSESTDNGKNKS